MKLGLLMFPSPTGSAGMAQLVEGLGFRSLVFADTQCLTPEVWSQLMLAASVTERIEIGTGVTWRPIRSRRWRRSSRRFRRT